MKKLNIAVVGATGLVGKMFLQVLEERDVPINKVYAFASAKSSGTNIKFCKNDITVEELGASSFDREIDICLFAAGRDVSKEYVNIAAGKGITVIDNSSAFRQSPDVPLIVPEVNPQDIKTHKGIIANPNCCAAPLSVALKPFKDKYGVRRVVVSTYQSVSGAGQAGISDLAEGISQHFPYPIKNNLIPHIDVFENDGYTGEETKIIAETRKILGVPKLPITATAVRVPIVNCHSMSVNVELKGEYKLRDVFGLVEASPGLKLVDDINTDMYPMPLYSSGLDLVQVGRLRRDRSRRNSLNMWIVADNIRKGAATNAVQILEALYPLSGEQQAR